MSPALYSEDTLVQQTTVRVPRRERLGWHSVSAYNTETFGPDGTLGRTSEEEVATHALPPPGARFAQP